MKWKIVNEAYLDYLRNVESRIPKSNYGVNKFKPFFGVLFDLDDEISYITQISHPQSRHVNMKSQKDLHKVYDLKSNKLLGVINLNYMFPIPKSLIEDLKYGNIESHRTFSSDDEKFKYVALLKSEIKSINTMNLEKHALDVYNIRMNYPNDKISQRCLDFKNLERLCKLYIENNLK